MSEQLRIIASRRNYDDTENIQIHDVYELRNNDDGSIDLYVTLTYKKDTKNILVLSEVFNKGDSPYDDDVIKTPYIVIENRVYYIADFESLGVDNTHVAYKEIPPTGEPIPGVLYAE